MSKNRLFFLTVLLLCFWLISPTAPVSAQNNGLSLSARAGFDGYYKPQESLPVVVTVANSGTSLEAIIRIQTNPTSPSDNLIYTAPVSLPTQSEKRLTLYPDLPNFTTELTVELLDENGRLLQSITTNPLTPMSNDDLLYAIVSSTPGQFTDLETATGRAASAELAYLSLETLPDAAPVWDAIDILIIDDVDSSQLTAAQRSALLSWLDLGGQLVITGGAGWQKSSAAFGDLLPVSISGSESVADLPNLSRQAGTPFRDAGPYVVATSSLSGGELLFHEDGLPILARATHGRGAAYFLALDPKAAPLADWDGSQLLWQRIANNIAPTPIWGAGQLEGYSAVTAVSALPSLTLPSFWQLVAFLVAYVLIIGPINYFVLKRFKRRTLAWVTIPAIVLIFTLATYFTGFQLRGNNTIINQMSIAYGSANGEQMRVQTLMGLYSPRRTVYDLSLPLDAVARPFENNFGNFDGSGNIEAVSRSSDLTLSEITTDVGSVETFVAESYAPLPPITGQANLRVASGNTTIEADIQNNSNVRLENAALILGNRVIGLGDIGAGQRETISESIATGGLGSSSSYGGTPLDSNYDVLLGTFDYYNDDEAYPRWQLLQAINGPSYNNPNLNTSTDVLTLVAWTEEAQLDISLADNIFDQTNTTLYFIELPLTQSVSSGEALSLPLSLLNWNILSRNEVYDTRPQNFYLGSGSWIEFEFTPWAAFQEMAVDDLSITLLQQNSSDFPPNLRLWNWETAEWDALADVNWGAIPIGDKESYIGNNNTVRIRLEVDSSTSTSVAEIYPVLSGTAP